MMSMRDYDDTDRPHHPKCPVALRNEPDDACDCQNLDEMDFDAEIDRRIDAEREWDMEEEHRARTEKERDW